MREVERDVDRLIDLLNRGRKRAGYIHRYRYIGRDVWDKTRYYNFHPACLIISGRIAVWVCIAVTAWADRFMSVIV